MIELGDRGKRAIISGTCIVILIICGIVGYRLEATGIIKLSCAFHDISGLNCPGCGLTRMVKALVAGELYQAMRFNPLAFFGAPILAVIAALGIKDYINYGRLGNKVEKCVIAVVIVVLVYGVLRNTPMFYLLSPTYV